MIYDQAKKKKIHIYSNYNAVIGNSKKILNILPI